ncbi:flagellar M-ring protein FliF [Ruegeria pomeroyi]|uniref:Flagellar M-ring protein n=1 Tax=Ruegeria alba TaxID=2916756 RepID=A0ABS9NZV3_9RHOB|nr:flagellar M-ring protein FliF [Ruegeria pomeroyi]MCE8526945.1 flagellar M-ring protein FliF [Ruegeria pomeroyi]MCE8530568.1 flagellar M-ring protein FliF [Ruegeria pomeroyi]MCG6559389.1 flagellar M-ring protein FliF [Ruegeria alba]
MQQIRNVWASLDKKRQFIVIGAVLAMFLGVMGLTRIAGTPNMQLLYAGLENGSAGEVVRSLEQQGVLFEVRGGSIYVPVAQRDELRLTLASEGLPANGGRGYELLDSLSGFGTTSQMFDAAYWRAKEGELARTIVASPHVAQARVHIANSSSSPFQRNIAPTASVSIVPSGSEVTPAQANAIRYLVASAISGMAADGVTVIDSNGNVIGPLETPNSSNFEERSQQMRERVLRLVEARVGRGNAIVEVSVDAVTETESIRERRLDPNGRIAISTDIEERSDASKNQSSDVTVASNLPDGDGSVGDESNSSTSATRERVNYEVSETETEILRAPGAIKRLSVAVLVNGLPGAAENGSSQFTPRPEEELSALRELVESAVGFDETRGDVITLKSMELPEIEPQGTLASSSMMQGLRFDMMSLIQMATLALVTLVLGLFVVRPILSKPVGSPQLLAVAQPSDGATAEAAIPTLTGEIDDGSPGLAQLSNANPKTRGGVPALAGVGNTPVERLRAMIGDKQEETIEILRGWLEENEEKV